MNASTLMGVLRLTHGVLDFLVRQPEDQVLALAQGRAQLAFAPPADAAQLPLAQPAPAAEASRAATKASRASTQTAAAAAAAADDHEAADIAEKLRAFQTEAQALPYLNDVAKNQTQRRAIAKALNIVGAPSLKKDELITLILRHAIGARRTFEGLYSW